MEKIKIVICAIVIVCMSSIIFLDCSVADKIYFVQEVKNGQLYKQEKTDKLNEIEQKYYNTKTAIVAIAIGVVGFIAGLLVYRND